MWRPVESKENGVFAAPGRFRKVDFNGAEIIPSAMNGPQRFRHEENKGDPHALQNYAEIFAALRQDGRVRPLFLGKVIE
jgi:hypothetical protein